MNNNLNKLIKYLFYLFCFFLPLIKYLNKNNLQEFIAQDIVYFIISLFLLLILLIISHVYFFKKYNYPVIYLILIFNITFIFLPVRDFFLINLLFTNYLSILISLFLYSFFFLIPLFFLKKKLFEQFLFRLSLAYFFLNFLIIFIDKNSLVYNFKEIIKEEMVISNFSVEENQLINKNNSSISNIYFVIADAMVPLDLAQEFGIISKKEIQNELDFYQSNGFEYVENSFANYDTTQLSLAAIFTLDYFTKPPDELTYKKSTVFPVILYHNDNLPLLQILKLKKTKFYYHGNSWAPCRQSLIVNCHFSRNVQVLNRVLLSFYSDTPFFFLTKVLKKIFKDLDEGDNRQLGNYQENFSKKEDDNEKKFIFIHHYGSHDPYTRDENCIKKNYKVTNFEGYLNAYRCSLKEIKSFIKFLDENDPNSLVIIQADHGYKHPKNKNIKHSSAIYNLIKYPKNCKKYELPRSNINSIIFTINCAYNTNIHYKDFIFYEDGYDYPNARFILKKHLITDLQ